MTPKQTILVQESWQKKLPIDPQAIEVFSNTLFERGSSPKVLFNINIIDQDNKLTTIFDTAVNLLNYLDKFILAVQKLGARHVDYGVDDKHYKTVGEALLITFKAS